MDDNDFKLVESSYISDNDESYHAFAGEIIDSCYEEINELGDVVEDSLDPVVNLTSLSVTETGYEKGEVKKEEQDKPERAESMDSAKCLEKLDQGNLKFNRECMVETAKETIKMFEACVIPDFVRNLDDIYDKFLSYPLPKAEAKLKSAEDNLRHVLSSYRYMNSLLN